ncbi:MAG: helix-turn-helix domain-containing protein [Blastocatellia bacterium]
MGTRSDRKGREKPQHRSGSKTIRIGLKETALKRGIENPRELHLRSGVSYMVCNRMWYQANQTRIDLPALARFCEALDCQPGDLLVLSGKTPSEGRNTKKRERSA